VVHTLSYKRQRGFRVPRQPVLRRYAVAAGIVGHLIPRVLRISLKNLPSQGLRRLTLLDAPGEVRNEVREPSSDVNGDGSLDTGLFVWAQGSVRLVARTGTVIPGLGTVAGLVTGPNLIPPPPVLVPNSGALNNDRGQVLFAATFNDGSNVLLIATPTP